MALKTCCGCISLKKGSLAIGIISLISNLILLIIACMFPAMIDNFINSLETGNNKLVPMIQSVVRGCSAGAITYLIILTILIVIFIIGVVKMNPTFILPFLWVGFTTILTVAPTCISLMTMASQSPGEVSGMLWGNFFEYLFGAGVNIYFLMVVYYYYQELKQRNHPGVIYPPSAP